MFFQSADAAGGLAHGLQSWQWIHPCREVARAARRVRNKRHCVPPPWPRPAPSRGRGGQAAIDPVRHAARRHRRSRTPLPPRSSRAGAGELGCGRRERRPAAPARRGSGMRIDMRTDRRKPTAPTVPTRSSRSRMRSPRRSPTPTEADTAEGRGDEDKPTGLDAIDSALLAAATDASAEQQPGVSGPSSGAGRAGRDARRCPPPGPPTRKPRTSPPRWTPPVDAARRSAARTVADE